MSIEIIIADDHSIVVDGLRAVLEKKSPDIIVAATACNGKEVLQLAETRPADVYLLDIAMPVLNGLETAVRLLDRNRNARIIILSIHDDRATVEKAVKAGAKGYLTKDTASDDLIKAIHEVYGGKYFFSPGIAGYLVNGVTGKTLQPEKNSRLTMKEREIIQLIAEGLSDKEIGINLNISINTVRVHKNNLMRKLNIHKQSQLVRYALKEGISHL